MFIRKILFEITHQNICDVASQNRVAQMESTGR
jgi:hypothetical protein